MLLTVHCYVHLLQDDRFYKSQIAFQNSSRALKRLSICMALVDERLIRIPSREVAKPPGVLVR